MHPDDSGVCNVTKPCERANMSLVPRGDPDAPILIVDDDAKS